MQSEYDTSKYYLGKLCPHGHDYKNTGKSLKRRNKNSWACVECNKERARKYRMMNLEKCRERDKNYYYANKERNKDKRREYYNANRDKIINRSRIYYENNTSKVISRVKEYSHNNNKRIMRMRKYKRRQINNNTQIAIKWRLSCLLRKSINKYAQTGKIMSSKKYGIDYGAIIAHLGPHPNTLGIKGKFHIDHIVPLSIFDLNDPEQIKLAFAPENHQWLEAKKNMKKHNKIFGQLNLMTQDQLRAVL